MRALLRIPNFVWLGLAFLLRLAFALKLGDGLYQADEHGFELPAWNIVTTGTFGAEGHPLIQPPLPSLFIAVFYKLFGRHPFAPRIGLVFASTAIAWLVARFVRDMTDSKAAGRLALILACVYPFFIYYGGMLTSEMPYLVAATAGLWLLSRTQRERGAPLWEAAAAGFVLGLAGLCRTEGVALFVIIILAMVVVAGAGWRTPALALLFMLLPLSVWSLRNHRHSGHWTLDEHAGTSLLHGTVVFEQNEIDTAQAMEALHEMPFWQEGWKMPEHEREKYFTQVAVQWMREHPGETARQWALKFVSFWRFYPRLDKSYSDIQGNNPAAGFGRRIMALVSLLFEPALILGGLWGLWLMRERWRELFPLWLFIAGTCAVHVLTVSQMRYRLPVMPILMLGFCWWLSRLVADSVA